MTNIYPYPWLHPSPSDSVLFGILVDNDMGGDRDITFAGETQTITPDAVPTRDDAYYYVGEWTGLNSDTVYELEVDGKTWDYRTLPLSLDERNVEVMEISDTHVNQVDRDLDDDRYMNTADEWESLRWEGVDLVMVGGDFIDQNYANFSESGSERWVEVGEIVLSAMVDADNGGVLRPIFYVPGNHEVDNSNWDGSGSTNDGEDTHFAFFNVSQRDYIEPLDSNYGAVTILDGDVQLVGIDSHSTEVGETGDWFGDVLDEDATATLFVTHSPLFSNQERLGNDPDLQENLRDELFADIVGHEPLRFGFAGHIHNHHVTLPLELVDEAETSESISVPEGDIVEADEIGKDTFVEWGDGQAYWDDRDSFGEWFVRDYERIADYKKTVVSSTESTVTGYERIPDTELRTETYTYDANDPPDATIELPNNENVDEIVLPNGANASEVYGPDGNLVWKAVDTPDIPDIPDSGGVHQWNTDEGSGTTLNDSIGNLDGDIQGATWVSGAGTSDTHLEYDGSGDEVELGDSSELAFLRENMEGTVGIWVKYDDVDTRNAAFSASGWSSSGVNMFLGYRTGDTADEGYNFQLSSEGDNRFEGGDATTDIGEWVFQALTASGPNDDLIGYVATPSNNYTITPVVEETTQSTTTDNWDGRVSMGFSDSFATDDFEGGIDYAFVDDEARTESDLQNIVDSTKKFYE